MRKFLGIAFLAMLALPLSACSTQPANEETTQAADSAQSKEGDTESMAGESETKAEMEGDALADAETFVIGSIGPLTGPAASYGTSVKQGSEIAIEEINAAGGVRVGDKTYKLALNFQDDEADPEMAVTAYNSLIDSKINVLLGCVTSGSSLAVVDLSSEDEILQITPSGSAQAITENPNVFRLCFTDPLQGKTIAKYVVDQGYESVAILYNNADEYSTGVYEAFKEELEAAGKGDLIVATESFVTEDVDYTSQLTKIKATDAKAIFVPGYYAAAAFITQQARANGITSDFIGSDGWDGVIAQVTDPSVLEGAVFLSPFVASDKAENVSKFVSAYQTAYNSIPDQFAADGYDTVYVIKAAMEKAGTINNADLINAMTEISVEGVTGKVSFDQDGEPKKEAKFVMIENGEYVFKDLN